MISDFAYVISRLFPDGFYGIFTIFFYAIGAFIVVSVVTAFISIVNHVKGLVSRGNGS